MIPNTSASDRFFAALAEAIFGAPMPVSGERRGTRSRKARRHQDAEGWMPPRDFHRQTISPAHSSSIRKTQRRLRALGAPQPDEKAKLRHRWYRDQLAWAAIRRTA